MQICGLQIIVLPSVPASLRYGRHAVVVTRAEAAELLKAEFGDKTPIINLLEGHAAYMESLEMAQ